MSETQEPSQRRYCPGCDEPLAHLETLCAQCRAVIEAQVLSVRVEVAMPLIAQAAVAETFTAVKSSDADEVDTHDSAGLSDDFDLLPFAPDDDEPPKATRAAIPVTETLRPIPTRPVPTAKSKGTDLAPTNRWIHLAIAVGLIVLAVGGAALLWSSVMPPHGTSAESPANATPMPPK